ncbi:HNH endonuclease [Kitasatospora sp. NPDC058184]|uniref:HNH endonuclease n=1 Tax=Kitasatospora sp. NPDC058184 TaxID=3346370 RepID=UPI0036DE0E19
MAWTNSNRLERLPRDWQTRRLSVLRRAGYQCEHIRHDTEQRCTELATDVDHIQRGDDHELSNLQALCRWHHGKKSAEEGSTARRKPRARRERDPEVHPNDLRNLKRAQASAANLTER